MKKLFLPFLILVSVVVSDSSVFADQPAKPQPPAEVLNNAAIIELNGLALGDAVILEKIKTSRCDFDVTLTGLKQLKAAAVPNSIISAMIAAKSASQSAGSAIAETPTDVNDPKTPHESGIWLCQEVNGKSTMIQLEPSVYSQSQSGGFFGAQFGVTTKSKAVLSSAHANLELTTNRPIFFFYFDKSQGSLSETTAVPTNPNQYVLAQFEVNEKDNQRAVAVGQFNAYSGTKAGTDAEAVRSFRSEKQSPGVFKIWVDNDLKNGEYGFYFAASAGASPMFAHNGGGKVFDFRINGTPDTRPQTSASQPTTGNSSSGEKKHPIKNFFQKIKGDSSSAKSDQTTPKASN